jgi:hypothetical protein
MQIISQNNFVSNRRIFLKGNKKIEIEIIQILHKKLRLINKCK